MEFRYKSALILLFVLGACDLSGPPSHWKNIAATLETQPVHRAGDAADDPAIWLNQANPGASLVVATDKRTGLYVYDLLGKELAYLESGEPNNVDLRELNTIEHGQIVLTAVSDRDSNAVKFFALDPEAAQLRPLHSDLGSELGEIYGLCMYQPGPDIVEVFATGRSGRIERYEVWIKDDGSVFMGRLAWLSVPSQAEGCVADDVTGELYVSEESTGIWHFDLSANQPDGQLLVDAASGQLVADIEGLALGQYNGIQYLVVSSQGNDSFVIYEKNAARLIYLGTFNIIDSEATDGVSETDGVELLSVPLGEHFPQGVLVVQDGDNAPASQNFKYISWQHIVEAFGL